MSSNHWLMKAAATIDDALVIPEKFRLEGDLATRWAAMVKVTGVSAELLATAAADLLGVPRARMATLDADFARQLPENVARTQLVVPLVMAGNRAVVAVTDPTDTEGQDAFALALGMSVDTCIATPAEIEAALSEIHDEDGETIEGWGNVPSALVADHFVLRRKDGVIIPPGNSATSKLFVELLRRSYHMGASDLHVQPYGDSAVVRNRVDGVLYRALELPDTVHSHLVRHVKAISGMDPTRHLIPQDGELHMELEHHEVDLRLSVLPVTGTERLVARLLPQNQVRSLDLLRLPSPDFDRIKQIARNADGMALMTGPTGSGKTSLLYAMLAEKNTPDINIMTVEEPVEYRLRGASQIDVDPRTGLTFERALRSILRQDPDVVMIGEIRDEETAGIAAQAAMTGHFVLSTVHTLDALLATVRMRDLDVSPATLADALNAVASQRLVRALCDKCKAPLDSSELSADEHRFAELWATPAWKAVGCDACRSTGFSGRVPVLEIVEVTGELRKSLRDGGADLVEMEAMAAAQGTRFLAEGFAHRVEDGATTVAEVLRVYGGGLYHRLRHYNNLRQALS